MQEVGPADVNVNCNGSLQQMLGATCTQTGDKDNPKHLSPIINYPWDSSEEAGAWKAVLLL